MIKVFYTPKMVVDDINNHQTDDILPSPSAKKPQQIYEALKEITDLEFIELKPVTRDDLKLAHDPQYVDNILDLKEDNGFGNKSPIVAESLLYTNGAMYAALEAATPHTPTCALVSGFHHAAYGHWRGFGYFCTFNGLMVAALKSKKRVAIIDCDHHYGNGTANILETLNISNEKIFHYSFGRYMDSHYWKNSYLKTLELNEYMHKSLIEFSPECILYQAGADVHINDPYGGVFTTEEIMERDRRVFKLAKKLDVPIAWNLAGGYQYDANEGISEVIKIHLNTFKVCKEVYNDLVIE